MAAFRPAFHTTMASDFVDDIFYSRLNFYFYVGYIQSWPEFTDDAYSEVVCGCECDDCVNKNGTVISKEFGDTSNPHKDPDNAYFHDTTIRDNIVYLHKITSENVSLVTKAYKWTSGTYYSQWDNTLDMTKLTSDRPFYCYNSEYNVYKCLNNNKYFDVNGNQVLVPSTQEPTGVHYDVIKTDDGYVWKYLYTIPITKRQRFLSTKYMPVQRSVQEEFYNRGAIQEVIVQNGGSGYSSEPLTTAIVSAPADGTQAEISLYINADTGGIDAVDIVNPGSGYRSDPKITIVDLSKRGSGLFSSSANLVAHIDPTTGQLAHVSIDDPGVNYPADTATSIVCIGDGTGFVGYPKVLNGEIVGVVVANPGEGYTYADIRAFCAKNTLDVENAVFTTRIGNTITVNDQSVVEQMATPGQIYAIELTNPGADYSTATEVEIDGDGSGCEAHVEITGNRISRVVIDQPGSGYTTATITFKDLNRKEPNDNPEAEAYAILPPRDGHGYNAVEELYGDTVSMHINIRSDNMLAGLGQEFRQFGVIKGLKGIQTQSTVSMTETLATFKVTIEHPMTTSENLGADSIVYIDGIQHRVVDVSGDTFELQQLRYIYHPITIDSTFEYTDTINNKKYGYVIQSVDKVPEVDKYSGQILYSSNNLPFYMQDNKTFGLRTFLRF